MSQNSNKNFLAITSSNKIGLELAKVYLRIVGILIIEVEKNTQVTSPDNAQQSQGILNTYKNILRIPKITFYSQGIITEHLESFCLYLFKQTRIDLDGSIGPTYSSEVSRIHKLESPSYFSNDITIDASKIENLKQVSQELKAVIKKEESKASLFSKNEEGELLYKGKVIEGINKTTLYYDMFDAVYTNFDSDSDVILYEKIEKFVVQKGHEKMNTKAKRNHRINNELRTRQPQGFFKHARVDGKPIVNDTKCKKSISFISGKGVQFRNS